MASNLFKTRQYSYWYDFNTNFTTSLTNSNTCFIHTYIGDDNTGDGTREFPYRSLSKASLTNKVYWVFRGVANEYVRKYGVTLIGDDINQVYVRKNYNPSIINLNTLTTDSGTISIDYIESFNYCNLNADDMGHPIYQGFLSYNFCLQTKQQVDNTVKTAQNIRGCTLNYLGVDYSENRANVQNSTFFCKNNIVTSVFNPSYSIVSTPNNYPRKCEYIVFPSTCTFKYNGTVVTPYENDLVTPATFGNDSVDNIRLIKNGYKKLNNASITTEFLNCTFAIDSFGNETCKIIKQVKDGGSHPNIFNKYDVDGVTPLDWTLNPDVLNEALWASDTGGYVGCFKPASPISSTGSNTFQSSINVNSDGTDTVTTGTLLLNNSDVISFASNPSQTSQTWNRIKGNNTITIPNGVNFKGINSLSTDGSPFGYYIGKKQSLINPTQILEGITLTVGKRYKVSNDTSHAPTTAVVYNGVSYLPDYFFVCLSGITSFTLLNNGSGTYLQESLADPLESVEITPYDDLTTVSISYPKFSCPLNGDVKILQYSATNGYGKATGTPVLFGDSTFCTELSAIKDKITYYDGYGITNADQEYYTLIQNSKFQSAVPILKYLRVELNGHFDLAYDY